ncbi:hypothetical protein BS618_20855 [Rhodococcus erythropolis]|nr:hypothetical protein AOT96_22315 [Rhodococcus sp. 008]OKA13059.1 hypothetical protein BS618_20855 [Rhodococcus erythropolis]
MELLFTDFFFTLPDERGALAHAAAGGNAHLLAVDLVPGTRAVHGTEMYGTSSAGHTHGPPMSRSSKTPSSATPSVATVEPTTEGIGSTPTTPSRARKKSWIGIPASSAPELDIGP